MMTEPPTTMDINANFQSLQLGVAKRDELLCKLVEIHRDHEPGLDHVVQTMYDLMKDNLLCSTELIHKVISAVISGSQEETSTRRTLLARALDCVQLQLRRIPAEEGKLLLQELLPRTSDDVDPYAGQILEHLFNDFVRVLGADCFLRLLDATQRLLPLPQDRKSSIFLIKKIQMMCEVGGEQSEALLHLLQCTSQQWTALAAIIADLEEQDPHLVVSNLEKQLPQLQLMASDLGEPWLSWLHILCLRLLREERVQVLHKVVKYFLTHLNVEQVCRLNLLPEFLVATNRSQFFDFEDDNCLKVEQMEQFVADGNVELLLKALVEVPWENVPLMFWICSFKSEQVKSVSKELFIKLCLVVRAIGKYILQRHIIDLFKETINGFSLRDYMICMESLFNKGDELLDYSRLIVKIESCNDFEEHIDFFNQRFFDIVFYDAESDANLVHKLVETLIMKMQTLPKHKHGFCRLVHFTNNRKVFMDFYSKFYKVDTSLLENGASLEKMQEHLLDRLNCQSSEETSFLKARCVDLFTWNLESWHQLEELNLDALKLIEEGTEKTVSALAHLLGTHEKRIKDEKALQTLIHYVTSVVDINNILSYAYRNLTEDEFESCVTRMLQKKMYWLPNVKLSINQYLKLLLHGEPTTGLARIEAACEYHLFHIADSNTKLRLSAIRNLQNYGDTEMKSTIFKELLRMNEKLSIEHPHYTENSEVHRQKIRIAFALIELRNYCDDPVSLETLLSPTDHLGINLMHEVLVGICVKNIDWVLEALPSLQPRQQESYLSIAYVFISKNLLKLNKENKLSKMFSQLLPYSMGSNHSTRILAQLFLHKLAVKCGNSRIRIPLAEVLIESVKTSLGEKFDELQGDPRLWFTKIDLTWNNILFITNVPFDENVFPAPCDNKVRKARQVFKAKTSPSSRAIIPPENGSEGLTLTPPEVNPNETTGQELILVTSLLDKEIDFAALRCASEKFGFNCLVVAKESHSEDSSSGNLRIVEVKSEALVEFILTKKAEGYRIVGSKLSTGVPKFDHFEFPQKCILVLGHEKHGIPTNVTEVLDYVMEIPQFGIPDTNLGASLFIWEFFKQHSS